MRFLCILFTLKLIVTLLHGQQVWTPIEGPPESFSSLACDSNDTCVGLVEGGQVFYTSDAGESWGVTTIGTGVESPTAVLFDGTQFCVTAKGWSSVSPDGQTWTLMRNDLDDGGAILIHAEPDFYLAVVQRGGSFTTPATTIYYSENLINWESVRTMTGWYNGIMTNGDSIFVATSSGGNHGVQLVSDYYRTTNGRDWIDLKDETPAAKGRIYPLGYANGNYYAILGSALSYSSNGLAWQTTAYPSSAGSVVGLPFEIGGSTVFFTTTGLIRSTDGQFFTFSEVPYLKAGTARATARLGDRLLVSVSSGVGVLISEDGITARPAETHYAMLDYAESNVDYTNYNFTGNPTPLPNGNFNLMLYMSNSKGIAGIFVRTVGPNTTTWQRIQSDVNIQLPNGYPEYTLRYGGKLYRGFSYGSNFQDATFVSENGINWTQWKHPDDSPNWSLNGGYWTINNVVFTQSLNPYINGEFKTPSNSVGLVSSISYGKGTYVAAASGKIFVATDPLSFDAYTVGGVGESVYFIDDQFVFPNTNATYVSQNGVTGMTLPQVYANTGSTVSTSSHHLAGDVVLALANEFNGPIDGAISGSSLLYSPDAVNYYPTIGIAKNVQLSTGDRRYNLSGFKAGNTYYLLSYQGVLMAAPEVQTSPTETELLAGVPDVIEASVGKYLSQTLVMPLTGRQFLLSELPLGLKLNTATGTLSGTPLKLGTVTAHLMLVTDTRIVQKEITFNVREGNGTNLPAALSNAEILGDSYYWTPWFGGFYRLSSDPTDGFVFANDFGWAWIAPGSVPDSVWWWSFSMNTWLWGGESTGRFFFRLDDVHSHAWIWVLSADNGGAYIYDLSTNTWSFLTF